jgi:hypothetical protein
MLVPSLVLVWLGWSVGGYLAAPGTDSAAARLAEWGRDHYLGGVVTALERAQYQRHRPKVGGVPSGGIPIRGSAGPTISAVGATTPAPAPVRILAPGGALPGEGRWQTVVTVRGLPAVRVAYLRPDRVHTSYLVGLMWLDPKLVSGSLMPGTRDPGGTWPEPTKLTPALRRTVVAAHNGGFRLPGGQSRGGYYSDGRTVAALRTGAASLVIYRNGTAAVGAWGREVAMSPRVRSVRQNLDMLVDNGAVSPSCPDNNSLTWGYTVGSRYYVPRSGFGTTANGGLIYVGGPAMSVCTLGAVLQAAGARRAMELDINTDWITGAYYTHGAGGVIPHKLSASVGPGPTHYFSETSRDWFAWFARP